MWEKRGSHEDDFQTPAKLIYFVFCHDLIKYDIDQCFPTSLYSCRIPSIHFMLWGIPIFRELLGPHIFLSLSWSFISYEIEKKKKKSLRSLILTTTLFTPNSLTISFPLWPLHLPLETPYYLQVSIFPQFCRIYFVWIYPLLVSVIKLQPCQGTVLKNFNGMNCPPPLFLFPPPFLITKHDDLKIQQLIIKLFISIKEPEDSSERTWSSGWGRALITASLWFWS